MTHRVVRSEQSCVFGGCGTTSVSSAEYCGSLAYTHLLFGRGLVTQVRVRVFRTLTWVEEKPSFTRH
jgi:hypothetical protein